MKRILISHLAAGLLLAVSACGQPVVTITCAGTSITYGLGVEDRERNVYPAQLQKLLGSGYRVLNDGVSGSTLLRKGDHPYWNSREYQSALESKPDIVFVELGPNDAKLINRGHLDEFENDYRALVRSFVQLPSHPKVILLLPTPSFATDTTAIWDPVIVSRILPKIQQVAYTENLELIDLHSLLADKKALLPDGVHPNGEAFTIISKRLYDLILQKKDTAYDIFSGMQGIEKTISSFYGYPCANLSFSGAEPALAGVDCKVVKPKWAAPGHPWVWRARFWGHEPQADIALLEHGFHIVYCDAAELFGNQAAIDRWNHFYTFLQHAGLSKKAALEGMSRGGVYAFNWAAVNPDKVACVYVDNPVLDLKSWPGGKGKGPGSPDDWEIFKKDYGYANEQEALSFSGSPVDKTAEIVKGGYPILILCADADEAVPPEENTLPFEQKIKALNGNITVFHKPGFHHHPHSLPNPTLIVDFIVKANSRETRISVDALKVINAIPRGMYGSCIEDVNHEIYGGLYDQRLYGESFEETHSLWDTLQTNAKGSSLSLDSIHPFNGRKALIIRHGEAPGRIGIANRGLNRWGIAVRKGQSFEGRIYLRAESPKLSVPQNGSAQGHKPAGPAGPVTIALENADGSKTYATQQIPSVTDRWEKYSFRLTADAADPKARFVVYIESSGKLWIDQAVLLSSGNDRFKGLSIRKDIAVKMQEEGLNFVRYGGSMVNAPGYRWKKMIGDPDKRPPYTGTWYPYSSNGFGIEDFLQFCEAAGFEAAFAINIEETDQDAADLAEYLKGDANTPWGKRRAANGHPAPYKLKYLEVGNEEVIDGDHTAGYDHYIARFNRIYKAIHTKYPSLELINAAWWRSQSTNMERVFKALDGKAAYWDLHIEADNASSGTTVDERLTKMQGLFLRWNPHTTMKCTIFEENGSLHNLQRALGHATTLNAVRRHGDFLLTSCAANGLQALGQNDNGWDQGQIFFTPDKVWGMPPFYAQQMAAVNHLPLRVATRTEGSLDVTATRSEDGKILVLHVINTDSVPIKTLLLVNGFPDYSSEVKAWTLSGDLSSENPPDDPERISTRASVVTMSSESSASQTAPAPGHSYTFPAHSYTILRFDR